MSFYNKKAYYVYERINNYVIIKNSVVSCNNSQKIPYIKQGLK